MVPPYIFIKTYCSRQWASLTRFFFRPSRARSTSCSCSRAEPVRSPSRGCRSVHLRRLRRSCIRPSQSGLAGQSIQIPGHTEDRDEYGGYSNAYSNVFLKTGLRRVASEHSCPFTLINDTGSLHSLAKHNRSCKDTCCGTEDCERLRRRQTQWHTNGELRGVGGYGGMGGKARRGRVIQGRVAE